MHLLGQIALYNDKIHYHKRFFKLGLASELKKLQCHRTSILGNLDERLDICRRGIDALIEKISDFTFSWEQRKLCEYLETSTEKNSDNVYGIDDVLSVSGDFGVVNQIEFQGRSFAGASVAGYGVLHTGEVVYTKSPLKSAPYGIIKTNKGKTGIVSVLYGVYHPRENLQPELVQIYFEQNARLNNYLRPLVNKGAKNTLLISDDDALQGNVIFPKESTEQEKICIFFRGLDRLITLHQREQIFDEL